MEVRRCAGCGLVFQWPSPDEAELARYYEEQYRDEYGDPAVDERYRADLEGARARRSRLSSLLRPDTRVLEVGCGSGAFLDVIRPDVKEVAGVEPDAASRMFLERTLRLLVWPGVAEVWRAGRVFDLVVLFHVLEHVPRPVEFLRTLRRIMPPQGHLVAEVPNVDDALVAVYKVPAFLRFYYQKAHLFYFSHATLTAVMEQAGFHARLEGVQRYDLSNHIRWMLTGEPGGQAYYGDMLDVAAQSAYASALVRAGSSDTLWAVAQPAPGTMGTRARNA